MKDKLHNDKKWHGLVKILEISHIDVDGTVLWKSGQLRNMLHTNGQQFILNALFLGGNSANPYIPNNYFFGLDARTEIAVGDTMATVNGVEPTNNGYLRQPVASTGQFTVVLVSNVYQANSPALTFVATAGNWGPVTNLFLSDKDDYSGTLIGSVLLGQSVTVTSGQSISMKMGLSLQDDS